MTEALPATQDADDARLLNLVRAGDSPAFDVIVQRHEHAARRLAQALTDSTADADDLVVQTFALVLATIQRGGGPTDAVRPYLLTALRRQQAGRLPLQADGGGLLAGPGAVLIADGRQGLTDELIVRAFGSLPERWCAVLWHTEIERAITSKVAPVFDLTRGGVAAVRRRAKEGLRQAYLQIYLGQLTRPQCKPAAERLGAFIGDSLSVRETGEVSEHLAECTACQAVCAELADISGALRAKVAPVILGDATAAYLSTADESAPNTTATGTALAVVRPAGLSAAQPGAKLMTAIGASAAGAGLSAASTVAASTVAASPVAASPVAASPVAASPVAASAAIGSTGDSTTAAASTVSGNGGSDGAESHGARADGARADGARAAGARSAGARSAAAGSAGAGSGSTGGGTGGGASGGGGDGWPDLTQWAAWASRPSRWLTAGAAALLVIAAVSVAVTLTAHGAAGHHHPLAGPAVTPTVSAAATAPVLQTSAPPTQATSKPAPSPSASPAAGTTADVAAPPPPAAAPTHAPARMRLAAGVSVTGSGGHRWRGDQVSFQVSDTGSAGTHAITVTITLPPGSLMFGGWRHGGADGASGWTCQPAADGATCQHDAIAAGGQASGTLTIGVFGGGACGQPVQLTATSGSHSASASSGGIPC